MHYTRLRVKNPKSLFCKHKITPLLKHQGVVRYIVCVSNQHAAQPAILQRFPVKLFTQGLTSTSVMSFQLSALLKMHSLQHAYNGNTDLENRSSYIHRSTLPNAATEDSTNLCIRHRERPNLRQQRHLVSSKHAFQQVHTICSSTTEDTDTHIGRHLRTSVAQTTMTHTKQSADTDTYMAN